MDRDGCGMAWVAGMAWIGGWVGGRMDGWMDGWMMDGWMPGHHGTAWIWMGAGKRRKKNYLVANTFFLPLHRQQDTTGLHACVPNIEKRKCPSETKLDCWLAAASPKTKTWVRMTRYGSVFGQCCVGPRLRRAPRSAAGRPRGGCGDPGGEEAAVQSRKVFGFGPAWRGTRVE